MFSFNTLKEFTEEVTKERVNGTINSLYMSIVWELSLCYIL